MKMGSGEWQIGTYLFQFLKELLEPLQWIPLEYIIDEKGKPLENFDFQFHSIIPIKGYYKSLGHWFLVLREGNENFELQNSEGELLTYDETTEANFLQGFYSQQDQTPYYFAAESNLNYIVI